jgi:hypothetical protein
MLTDRWGLELSAIGAKIGGDSPSDDAKELEAKCQLTFEYEF